MSSFQQTPVDGPCLRYPDNLGLHREITYENAIQMLAKAHQLAQTVPFTWGYIDKPAEGQISLIFLPNQGAFVNDGIRFQDSEVKYTVPVNGRQEMEVHEIKWGFIPGSGDINAWRLRRRYHFIKGGDQRLVLVHYTRGPSTQIIPSFMNQPVRMYPLQQVNEPAVFVLGEKAGQKVYPPGAPHMHGSPASAPQPQIGIGMNMTQQQAMLAQQNNSMEMLERRRERERARERSANANAARPPRMEEDDSGDEVDLISTRSLALARYRRNHDLMNEVFKYAAYGNKDVAQRPTPYSVFSQSQLEEKVTKLQEEVKELKMKSASRKAGREAMG